jgi:competence protein ComEC
MDQKRNTVRIFVFISFFLFGVFISSFRFVSPILSVLIIFIGLVIFAVEKVWNKSLRPEILILSVAIISFGIGALRYEIKNFHIDKVPDLVGIVISEPEQREDTTRFVLRTDNGEKILVSTHLYTNVQYGDRVSVAGRLTEPGVIEDGVRRPFDYGAYLAKDDIYHTIYFSTIEKISSGGGNRVRSALIKLKLDYIERAREILPEPGASLFSAFTIAGKSTLPKDVVEEFRRVGIIHVVVLSGYHVTLVTFFLFGIFRFIFWRAPHSSEFVRFSTIGGLGTFVMMAGASASILRAALMAFVAIGGKLIHRNYNISRALLFAAFLLVLINPKTLVFDVSFHLSFLATAGIIYLWPIVNSLLTELLPRRLGPMNLSWIITILGITISAQLAVSPYILYAMGDLSIVALTANVLILPVVPVTMFVGFLAVLISFASITLALPISYIAHLLLSWILAVSHYLANLPFANYSLPNFPLWATITLYIVLIILAWRFRNFSHKFAN